MRSSIATSARARQSNSVGHGFPPVALDCPPQATEANAVLPDATLALLDEVFMRLTWKHEYVAKLMQISPSTLSRALNESDRKTFDVRWLTNLPAEFWVALNALVALKFNISHASRQELILESIDGHLDSLKTLVSQVVVSK